MKSITNKTTEIKNGEVFLDYADLLKAILNVTPQGGISVQDMKMRLKLHDVIDKSNGTIEFEDSDYNYLKPLLANMKWGISHKNIVEFSDDFDNAEKQK